MTNQSIFDFTPPNPTQLEYASGTLLHTQIYGRRISFFVTNPKDPIQNHHLRGTFFEPDELNIIAKHIKSDAICVDIGANIGNHALFFDMFTPAKEVILFEVNPDALFLLNVNYLLNRPASWDLQYLGYALGSITGRVSKHLADPDNMGSAQFRKAADGQFHSITGDSVLASRRVDFVKIDVEGAELDVMTGMHETISRWRPTIFVELRNEYYTKFTEWLNKYSYSIVDKFERYIGLPNYLITST
jgi:FkbM family methyltransferase